MDGLLLALFGLFAAGTVVLVRFPYSPAAPSVDGHYPRCLIQLELQPCSVLLLVLRHSLVAYWCPVHLPATFFYFFLGLVLLYLLFGLLLGLRATPFVPSAFFLQEYRAAHLLVVLLPVFVVVVKPFGHHLAASLEVVVVFLEVCCPRTVQVGLVVVFVVFVAAMVETFVV